MKRLLTALAVAAALAVPAAALAFGAATGQNVTVPKGETKSGTYYAAGQVITIDGDINGDLICGGNSVTVNGAVHGDVICAGQTVSINGPVDGSVRVAGQSVDLGGTVGRNVMVAGQTVNLGNAAKVNGDLGMLAQTAVISGPVEKDVYGAVQNLTLDSTVGTVNAQVDNLTMGSSAKVNGDLNYTSANTFTVDKTKVTGQVNRTAAPAHQQRNSAADAARAGLAARLYWIFAALLVGLAFSFIVPKLVTRVSKVMLERPGASIGWGLILTLLGPIVVILLFITIIGVPLGLLVGVLYMLLVTTSGIFAGIAAGEWFVRRAEWRNHPLLWATLLGVPLSVIVFSVPVLGWIIGLVATFWAVGGVALSAKSVRG